MRLARLPGKNRKRRRTMNPDEPNFNPLSGNEEEEDKDNSRSSLAEISSEIRGPEDTAGDNPEKELALKFLEIGKQHPTYATFLDIYKQYNKCQGKQIDP